MSDTSDDKYNTLSDDKKSQRPARSSKKKKYYAHKYKEAWRSNPEFCR